MKIRNYAFLAVMLCAAGGLAAARSNSSVTEPQAPGREPSPTHMQFEPELLTPAALNAKAPAEFDVKFVTTKGEFTVHVARDWAPIGADRFYNLVKHHYFDGVAFFRVLRSPRLFMAQFGLSPFPQVNRAWSNAAIKDDPVKKSNTRGMISYAAQNDPNTRTTQIFINFTDNSFLDRSRFAPFAEVTSGMDVVDQFFSGYGEQPDQGRITNEGQAYIAKEFPKLDSIKTARIVAAPAAAPAPK
jgi:peptidyl-prolyl cis-trans isomerase A (cyclophilin A)